MKTIICIIAATLLPGCVCNVAWRGVVNNTQQKATTEGTIENTPWYGDTTISAEKATDATIDLPMK